MVRKILLVLLGTTSMFAVPAAMAQVNSVQEDAAVGERSDGLERIVVSARKREESLQDVPVAVVAIPQSALQNNLANDLSKIAELAPQVMIGRSFTGTGALLTIRGISSAAVDSGVDQSVTMNIDGVALSRGRVIQSAMFDMQQVEILQGPQALFFGKNSPAGVFSITSVDPGNSLEGYVRAGYEFEAEEKYVEAAVGGPLSSQLKARLAFRYGHMNGWIRNIARPGPNPFQPTAPLPGAVGGFESTPKGSNTTGRVTLLWEPSDDFSAKLKVTGNRERLNSMGAYGEPFCVGGQTVETTLGVPRPDGDCAINRVKAISALPPSLAVNYPRGNGGKPYERSDLALASLILNKSFGEVTLTSTTGYYFQNHQGADAGNTEQMAQIWVSEYERFRQFNQEIRLNTEFLGPLNGMIGAYYEHSDRIWENNPNLFNIFNTVAQNYTSAQGLSDSDNTSYSVFGQLRWKIVPSLELAGGVRYSHDKKKTAISQTKSNPVLSLLGIVFIPDNIPINGRFKDSNVSPEVTLTWKPEPDQTLYAAYKTGYKAGGISNGGLVFAPTTAQDIEFGPEEVKGFEVGYKAALLNNTLRLDVVGYRYNYDGLQVTQSLNFRYFIRNAAKARTYGVTAMFDWLATDRVSFNGNIGWNRARYLSFPGGQCYIGQTAAQGCDPAAGPGGAQNNTGKALLRAPRVTAMLGVNYKADLTTDWTADFSLSGAHTSSYETHDAYGPGGRQPSFWYLNAAVHVGSEDGRYRLSLIARNLLDEFTKMATYQSNVGTPNEWYSFLNRPREIVIQLSYGF